MSTVAAELNRLLATRRFSGAPQMSAFLRYIVTETINGHGARIKAYSVGVDALGKPISFDAQSDPSVRVLALRLRRTLAAEYQGSDEHLAIIDLRVGTYVPEFYQATDRLPDKIHANVLAMTNPPETKGSINTINYQTKSANDTAPELDSNKSQCIKVMTDSALDSRDSTNELPGSGVELPLQQATQTIDITAQHMHIKGS